MAIEEHRFDINGLTVCCHAAGPADGPPVVLLHGWGASWHYWQWALPALAAAGFRAYAPDLIGHGDTAKPPLAYGGDDYLNFAGRLIDHLGLKQLVLGGHSLGGYIALRYALEYPDRVQKLVLISPLYQKDQLPVPQGLLPLVTTPLRAAWWLTPAQLIDLAARTVRESPERILPVSFSRQVILDYKRATPRIATDIAGFDDLTPDLGRITVPALVFWGSQDLLALESFTHLAQALPNAQAHYTPAAAHAAHVETLVTFHDALLRFLEPAQSGLALPLHGPHVTIQPQSPADIRARARWRPYADPLYQVWNPVPVPAAHADALHRQRSQDPTRRHYTISVESNQVIGELSLRQIRLGQEARLGITLGADWIGRGYGTEALRVFIPYYFNILQFQQLLLDVAAANIRAVRCYENLGFQHVGEFRRPAGVNMSFLSQESYAPIRQFFNSGPTGPQALYYEMQLTRSDFIPGP
ncbi:MAG: alpha/beta fold hydrolase [Chloroflexi bacterium]|nr:alpha/beta fold hydrolase [Chloroflexota bacterium]MBU1749020.1 alpha/beta fold hydrolase [Chloroflexota bacterium]